MTEIEIKKKLAFLGTELCEKLLEASQIAEIAAGKEILTVGQRIQAIPIVLKGLLKVFTRHEDKDLLLYYIKPEESCIMSFSACLSHQRSSIYAQTLEDCTLMLIPSDTVDQLAKSDPQFNLLFHQQYQTRYNDLLNTINELVFTHLDERLLAFIRKNISLSKEKSLSLSHREIANELGTAREVVSRLLKKLEKDGKITQHLGKISLCL